MFVLFCGARRSPLSLSPPFHTHTHTPHGGPWVTAFDAYALAAASVQQWSYAASMAHKSLMLKIAGDARANNTSVAVAVIYDELVRQRKATRAASKAPNFSPDNELLEVDRTLLERAAEPY